MSGVIDKTLKITEATSGQLEGIRDTCVAELKRRQGWPTQRVYFVTGLFANDKLRFKSINRALDHVRESVFAEQNWRENRPGLREGNVTVRWYYREYDPDHSPPATDDNGELPEDGAADLARTCPDQWADEMTLREDAHESDDEGY